MQKLKTRFIFPLIILPLGSCSTPPKQEASQSFANRKVASISAVTPFEIPNLSSPVQIVDAVIKTLGPVRHQRDTQICFGHAVADVATFHSGKRVSAFSVAVRNFQFRRGLDYLLFNPGGVVASQIGSDSRYMLGLASSTLEASLKGTLCADDQPSNDLSYRDVNLKQLWDVYHNQYRAYVGPQAPTHLHKAIEKQLSRIVPALDSSEFIKHTSRYKPLDEALGNWFDHSCGVRVLSDKLNVVGSETRLSNADQVVKMLDKALEIGALPVIHYDPGVLQAESPSIWQTAIGFHISLIVARADMNGVRYFLLRNSWGSNCQIYDQDIASRCDRGHIWLSESEVRKYVTSVAYLKRNE